MKQFVAMVFALAFGVLLLLPAAADAQAKKPNIVIIWGDDIGYWNISAYNQGMMGYKTPNIDRIAREGALFTDWYGEQSCTAKKLTRREYLNASALVERDDSEEIIAPRSLIISSSQSHH